jgi:hypothetical protein
VRFEGAGFASEDAGPAHFMESARGGYADLIGELEAAKAQAVASGRPSVVVGDPTAMSFEAFDVVVQGAAEENDPSIP